MQFNFKATRADGTETTGTKDAVDRFQLARDLRIQGLTVISAEPLETAPQKKRFSLDAVLNRVSIKDLIIFAGSLSAMIGAGLSLARALEVLERQTSNKRFKQVIASILDQVNKGATLSQTMKQYPDIFPPVFVAMVAAGEESGNLSQSLEVVRSQLAKSYDLRRKVKGAMIYPAIIVCVIIIIGILMMIYLVPQLTGLFKELEVELPLSTRLVVATSDFLSNHTIGFVAAVLVLLVLGIRGLRSAKGRELSALLAMKAPAIKTIVKNLNAAITMRTLASLISAGVSMLEAIAITGEVLQNPYYRAVMSRAGEVVQKGQTLSVVFKEREDIFPVLVGEMAEVGEETGNLSGMLLKGASFFEEEVDQATKNLSTIIEPALMVLIGIAVGFFAISMLGPMYSLTDAL